MSAIPQSEGDWRESDVVKQARAMLCDLGSPLWSGLTESDWAQVLRGVLAERDFIGEWLQRMIDAEHEREQSARPRRGGPHAHNCSYIVSGGDLVCDCPT